MRPLITFMVQLQSLVLGVGGGMQEKDSPNLRLSEGDEVSPQLPSQQLVPTELSSLPSSRKIINFAKGDVKFQPKNNHGTSQL